MYLVVEYNIQIKEYIIFEKQYIMYTIHTITKFYYNPRIIKDYDYLIFYYIINYNNYK